jgi:predicted O-methyltransferase YrrM
MRVTRSKIRWVVEGLGHGLAAPRRLRHHFEMIYGEAAYERSRFPAMELKEIIGAEAPAIRLENFLPENKNISVEEMVAICLLAAHAKPKRVLELGTFNGNTTLQLAANTPADTRIDTADLPDSTSSRLQLSGEKLRRFAGTQYESRIRQIHDDTLTMDFGVFCADGRPDFVFIDAGHSYACVKNDTEKVFRILASGGIVLWHDYAYNCAGVFNYLNELALERKLRRIAGTSLVYFRAAD